MQLTFTQAIARQEGYGVSGCRSTRNNNPGDIEWGAFARTHGATRVELAGPHAAPRFAYFPAPAIGFAAMSALLKLHYVGLTVEQVVNKYAPPVENNCSAYLKDVCEWTGLTPSTVLTEALLEAA